MDYSNWTYDEFIGYLMIYASHADFIVNRDEVKQIIEEIGRAEYTRISEVFDKQSDAERAEAISILGSMHCQSPEKKEAILDQLQELLYADDTYRTEEQAFFFGIKMLLG